MSGLMPRTEPSGTPLRFQSPDGDSLCPDTVIELVKSQQYQFQSPDGDSLCPDQELPAESPVEVAVSVP